MKKSSPSKVAKFSSQSDLREKIDLVLGFPALLVGDDEDQFNRLEEALIGHIKPQDIIEEIWARDLVERSHDVLRLRRWKVQMIEVREAAGIRQALCNNISDPYSKDHYVITAGWMKKDPDSIKKVYDVLSPQERSHAHIEANTIFLNLESLTTIEHLLQMAEARRDVVIREIERHRDLKAKRGAIDGGFKEVKPMEAVNDHSKKD
jgi:hypothetical protein